MPDRKKVDAVGFIVAPHEPCHDLLTNILCEQISVSRQFNRLGEK
jgi:hypothetical protein